MYSNVHGVAGTLIVLATHAITKDTSVAIALGGTLAFLSHDPLDRLGEKSYGSLATTIRWEGFSMWIFALAAYLSGQWPLFAVGWIAGNGMDIIDKKLYLSIALPSKFGPSWTLFPCHRRKPDVNLTLAQTRFATLLSSLVIAAVA